MEKLRDCLEEMVKYMLHSRADFDLGVSGDFCSALIAEDPAPPYPLGDAGDRFSQFFILFRSSVCSAEYFVSSSNTEIAGVPEYPLYKRLALGLLKSIESGSFCGAYEKKAMVIKEENWLKEKEEEFGRLIFQKGSELVNALKDMEFELSVQEPLFSLMKDGKKTVEGSCFVADYNYNGLRQGSLVMLNKCLALEVVEVHRYSSVYEMLKAESPAKVFPGVNTVEEGMEMFRKLYKVEAEKGNDVFAIHVCKAASQPCMILANIFAGLSYIGVQRLVGLSHTTGSILHALPPPRSILFSSFMLLYKPKVKGCALSHGARALAKHVDRCSNRFWGILHGCDSNKNSVAVDILSHLVVHCCWMNVHMVHPHGHVFEIRIAQGYGARWSRDGTKFIGFIEPYMDDGHSKGWKH